MKAIFFIKKDDYEGEYDLSVVDKLRERGIEVEVLDKDEPTGSAVANVYDIYSTPSVLVTMENGTVTGSWIGSIPPEADIVAAAEV